MKEIDEANKQVKVVLELLWYLLRCGVPWALEHPRSSFLWKTAEIQELLHDGRVDAVGITMCAFGTAWMKSTTLAFGNCDSLDVQALEKHSCHSRRVCAHSGKPHVQLVGHFPGTRVARTAVAQKSPPRLSRTLARIL